MAGCCFCLLLWLHYPDAALPRHCVTQMLCYPDAVLPGCCITWMLHYLDAALPGCCITQTLSDLEGSRTPQVGCFIYFCSRWWQLTGLFLHICFEQVGCYLCLVHWGDSSPFALARWMLPHWLTVVLLFFFVFLQVQVPWHLGVAVGFLIIQESQRLWWLSSTGGFHLSPLRW